eukprot:gene13267-14571_t
MSNNSWIVHKFGGTSVGDASCMRKCIEIVRPLCSDQRVAVVVSAMGGKPKVTDLLLDLVHAAANLRLQEIQDKMLLIEQKHDQCVNIVLKDLPLARERILNMIRKDLKDIADLLRAVQLMRIAHDQILELVSGYGEIWSANIMTEAMRMQGLPFIFVNARDVLYVSEEETIGTKVLWEESESKLQKFLVAKQEEFLASEEGKEFQKKFPDTILPHLMITGYIASTRDGVATTLKRDGSDFSASIFGKMLSAKSITIWTDVSGVYSADPRRVPEAQIIPTVSYNEAIELAYFGAKVIHPKTMAPAIMSKIPIYIRNTFEPEHEGTRIYLPPEKGQNIRERSVCGFTTVDNISLLNLEGTGMIGVPGIANRLFGALKNANVSVMYIAQASSEHSICFATRSVSAQKAKLAAEEAFFYELKQGFVSHITVIDNCSIIAAVGDRMSHMPGVSGLFFGALGGAGVNILSISQGCDERNISAVVYSKDAERALRAVHSAFWLSSLEVSIGIIGTGRVGSAFLQALLEARDLLENRFDLKIKIRGVSNSRKMILGDNDLTDSLKGKIKSFQEHKNELGEYVRKSYSNVCFNDLEQTMSDAKMDTNINKFIDHVLNSSTPHIILIDATTSYDIATLHPNWLSRGCHVVTANKRAISDGLDLYNAVMSAARAARRMYMSEVTIGAALPIFSTLQDLLWSGDGIHEVVGIMSVSTGVVLTDICDHSRLFSDTVSTTFNRGLFEDDVFRDLEGVEAAEKLIVLARTIGINLSVEDVEIEPLATRRPITTFVDLTGVFPQEDRDLAEKARQAKERGCTLRYVQRIKCTPAAELGNRFEGQVKASVRLEEVPLSSPLAAVKGPVYYFEFHTDRYAQNPLIIQGPLSDSANTASGMVGDLLRIARSLGAKDKGPLELGKSVKK